MSLPVTLGRLAPVPLRAIWPDEARDFTPWLAQSDNLELLADLLGCSTLEALAVEQAVGRYAADILVQDADGRLMLIENQLEPSDHNHLGQILTYTAGIQIDDRKVKDIIWIAPEFREEHRAAVDWLNAHTPEEINFFAIEVSVCRLAGEGPIKASECAPNFTLVCSPNNWSRAMARASKASAQTPANDTQKFWMGYWQHYLAKLTPLYANAAGRTPYKDGWQTVDQLGGDRRVRFHLAAVSIRDQKLRIEVYISGPLAKAAFAALEQQRAVLDSAAGLPLCYENDLQRKSARIAVYLDNQSARNEAARERQVSWLVEWTIKMAQIMRPAIAALDLDKLEQESFAIAAEA